MTTVRVRLTAFIAGELPGICVVTGEPTSDRTRMAVRTGEGASSWWFKLVVALFGSLEPLSVSSRGLGGGSIAGWLPVSEGVQRRRWWRRQLPRLRLDASRRWMIIDGAHPAFVRAVLSGTESGKSVGR